MKKAFCPPILFPGSKVKMTFDEFTCLVSSQKHIVTEIEYDEKTVRITFNVDPELEYSLKMNLSSNNSSE